MPHRFVIGIGSQRAASTLMHRLVGESTDVFMHPVKELHYFDTLFGVRPQAALTDFSLRQLSREVERIVAATDFSFIGKRYRCFLRATKILATTAVEKIDYLDLYRPFLKDRAILGEVTPEYMLLNDAQVDRMRSVVGEDACVILMCRNPVDRILSAAKLFNTYNNLKLDDAQLTEWLKKMIAENSLWMQAQDLYNDYERAINIYSAAFNYFIAIDYDELISRPGEVADRIACVTGLAVDRCKFSEGVAIVSNDLGISSCSDKVLMSILEHRYEAQLCFLKQHLHQRSNTDCRRLLQQ
jgi:hypothetical protein